MNTWASQSTSFPKESFPYFNGLFFLFINTNNRQLGRSHIESTDIVYKNRFSCYCWQNGHAEPRSFVGPCQDMSLRCWRTGINETEPLPWLAPSKKGNDNEYFTYRFLPHLKIYWPNKKTGGSCGRCLLMQYDFCQIVCWFSWWREKESGESRKWLFLEMKLIDFSKHPRWLEKESSVLSKRIVDSKQKNRRC